MQEFELVEVASGAKSLRSLEFGQTFHPVTGPMNEAVALHVAQQRLAERAGKCKTTFVIWDVGFGAAANALAAIEALSHCGRAIRLHSFDRTTASIEFALRHAEALGYVARHEKLLRELLSKGNAAIGDAATHIEWRLHLGDFCGQIQSDNQNAWDPPHAIFYDPYSPSANPGMWTLEHFSLLRKRLNDGIPCLLTNYTRSTAVRVTLLLAGFFVGEGCGIGGKEETTAASNDLSLIGRPLDARWLERVRRSTNSAPLRRTGVASGPISREDWEHLFAHPQFSP